MLMYCVKRKKNTGKQNFPIKCSLSILTAKNHCVLIFMSSYGASETTFVFLVGEALNQLPKPFSGWGPPSLEGK